MARGLTLMAAVVLGAGVAACGGDPGGASGGVSDALNAVSATAAGEQSFAYTDLAALREVTDLPHPDEEVGRDFVRWNIPAGLGAPQVTQGMFNLRGSDGHLLDLFSADRFVTIGFGRDSATRIDGLEGDAEALTRMADASTVEDGTVVVAREAASRDAALGEGGDPLGDKPAYAAAADCLGDVIAAQISPAKLAAFPDDTGALVAIGVRGGDKPADVLCVVGDEGQAQRADAALRRVLGPDAEGADERLADSFASIDFDTGGSGDQHWARVVAAAKPDGQLGAFYRAIYQMLLARAWFGPER